MSREDNYRKALEQILLNLEYTDLKYSTDPNLIKCIVKILDEHKIIIISYPAGKALSLFIEE